MVGRVAHSIEQWDRDMSGVVAELVEAALPDEGITEDELLACLWEDPAEGVTLGIGDGEALGSAIITGDAGRLASVKLIAVRPDVRRLGYARRVLGELEAWAR